MFDTDIWRTEVQRRCWRMIRNPRSEVALFGTERLLFVLASRVLEPFFEQFTLHPLEATMALGKLTQSPGTSFLIHNGVSLRYQQLVLWARIHHSPELRKTVEHIFLQLNIIPYLIQEMGDINGEWFRTNLRDEIEHLQYKQEFTATYAFLSEPPWQTRYAAIQNLQRLHGTYTDDEWALLSHALVDHSAHVRAAAARQIGATRGDVPQELIHKLFDIALYDRDVGARYASSRALGMLKAQLDLEATQEQLVTALFHEDTFTRSAACLTLAQFGPTIAAPHVIDGVLEVLKDSDPYAREAAATALGTFGAKAVLPEVFEVLSKAILDSDQYVHEAALGALRVLRNIPQEPESEATE